MSTTRARTELMESVASLRASSITVGEVRRDFSKSGRFLGHCTDVLKGGQVIATWCAGAPDHSVDLAHADAQRRRDAPPTSTKGAPS